MKKLMTITTSAALLSALAVFPAISQAQLNVDLGTNADLSADTDTLRLDNALDVNLDADAQADLNREEDEAMNNKNNSDSETKASTRGTTTLRLNSSGVAITSSSQVNSESDLEVFSANASIKESSVSRVDIDSDDNNEETDVKVVYRHEGKFLGFIPVTIKSTTTVAAEADNETTVRSKMAWWGFLVTGTNYSRADMESRVRNNTTVQANAKANASAQAKASVAEAVIAELEAYAQANASASSKTSIDSK